MKKLVQMGGKYYILS